jgi:hypothetical protein
LLFTRAPVAARPGRHKRVRKRNGIAQTRDTRSERSRTRTVTR